MTPLQEGEIVWLTKSLWSEEAIAKRIGCSVYEVRRVKSLHLTTAQQENNHG